MSRIIVSVLAALLLFLAIKSNLILGFMEELSDDNNSNDNNYLIYTICFIAGFSETFVPSFMDEIENMNSQ